MGLAHSPRIVTDGLVLALDAGNAKSYPGIGTDLYDLVSDSSAVLSNGATINNNSIVFDGVDSSVDLPKSYFDSGDEFSISIWFKFDQTKDALQFLVYAGQADGFGNPDEFHIYCYGPPTGPNWSAVVFAQGPGDVSSGFVIGSGPLDPNKFNNIVFTAHDMNGSFPFGIVYTNGVQVSISTSTGTIGRTPWSLYNVLGRPYNLSNDRAFKGSIQMFNVYDRALTASEVKQNFNVHRGRFGI